MDPILMGFNGIVQIFTKMVDAQKFPQIPKFDGEFYIRGNNTLIRVGHCLVVVTA